MSLDADLTRWLDNAATALDDGSGDPGALLRKLAEAGLFRIGVVAPLGGDGATTSAAVEALAQVSERSLAAGFVFWGHRTYVEYLLQSPNAALRDWYLEPLLSGEIAGATGLSNAMKFLGGLEELQISAERADGGFALDGKLPWVTNLQSANYLVAAAVSGPEGRPFIASIPHHRDGVERSPDLDLMGMRSTATAAIKLTEVRLADEEIIAPDATGWLPVVRPAFLALQCGMSIGLARRSLSEAEAAAGSGRHILRSEIDAVADDLAQSTRALLEGLDGGQFVSRAPDLFHIRISLCEIAAAAVQLELQASGGKCYLTKHGEGFARRWREAAFLPLITPSLVQLKAALESHLQAERAA